MLVVLGVLLTMGLSGFIMEGLRIRIEASSESWSFVGTAVAGLLASIPVLDEHGLLLYRILWWAHAAVAFGIIAAVPYSPLRHALTSPLQILVASDRLSGKLTTPFRLADLLQSGSFDVKVGVDSVEDFSWRERLALAACTDSGGCQEVCPAHATGTALSPMRLMEDLEGRLKNGSKSLLDGSIAEDAIWSCTLCGACTDQCPVLVDPMSFVTQLRRGLVAGNRLGKKNRRLTSCTGSAVPARSIRGSGMSPRPRSRSSSGPACAARSWAPRSFAAATRQDVSAKKACSRTWSQRISPCSKSAASRKSSRTAPTVSTRFTTSIPSSARRSRCSTTRR
jgi:ferredoxin